MRELQIGDPKVRRPQPVTWLEFAPSGTELVVQLNSELRAYDLNAGTHGLLFNHHEAELSYHACSFALSPDQRLLAVYHSYDSDACVTFAEPTYRGYQLPQIDSDTSGDARIIFTQSGDELIAVRNFWDHEWRTDVVRLSLTPILTPKRLVQKMNPFNRKTFKTPATLPKWKSVLELPHSEWVSDAALSTSGQLVAAGTAAGTVLVVDLKKKKVVAEFPWAGRNLRNRIAKRVAFDPAAEWVVSLAAGRLSAFPLTANKTWRVKESLGAVHDFAFHPDGRVLCAAFADGQARFLDPLTGAVLKSFKWSKKPKPLHSVAFARDGLTCAVGTADGKVIVWDVDV